VSGPVVLFDGECHLCHGAVRWIIRRDRRGEFRFASLQSAAARRWTAGWGALPDSVVLVDEAGVHTQSTAALRIAGRLGWPYSWLGVFRLVPRGVRDGVYGWIARNRYRWFGRRDACVMPTPELAARLLPEDGVEG